MHAANRQDRRALLRTLGRSLGLGTLSSLLPQLALLPRAAQAQGVPDDYKALVCIYLAGGNDSWNWLVPRDSESAGSHYDTYRQSRGGINSTANPDGLALGFQDLLPIRPAGSAVDFGLHPSCADYTINGPGGTQAQLGIRGLFAQGKAAFVTNVGPLLQPLTKAAYRSGAPRPQQLFSHNDQERLWHLGLADTFHPAARHGWGGRLAAACGARPLDFGLSPAITISGSAPFLVGDGIIPYQAGGNFPDLLDGLAGPGLNAQKRAVLDALLADPQASPFAQGYAEIAQRSIRVGDGLSQSLLEGGNLRTPYSPGNALAIQLAIVSYLIRMSKCLGARRQVYYVRMLGFDHHGGLFQPGGSLTESGHGRLLTRVNQALGAFWNLLDEFGARPNVTTFTMSEFARTLSGNGSGSDHAWGGNMLVLGDAVRGGRLYGRYPRLVLDGDDAAGSDYSLERGQYIPTTAIEQVGASLARWMGVTDPTLLSTVFPLLSRFPDGELGLMG